MKTTIPEVCFEIDGDLIRMQQDISTGCCGTSNEFTLHRIHFEHIAGQLGIPVLTGTAAAELARRLEVLRDQLSAIADNEEFREVMISANPWTPATLARFDAVCDLAEQFTADIVVGPRHDNSPGISVTGGKRGRPATGQAMSDAERQAKHRAKATAGLFQDQP